MLLPTTTQEMRLRGWEQLDIILVTGDSYIDSPFIGTAVVGNILADSGYRVGIIAQPVINSPEDITRLGEPRLFWGVTGGSIDSMVANYTALKKKRKSDDFTPGGTNDRRPDRAVIVYSNLIRHYFKSTQPIVLGGIEASLRRIAHYDYWSNRIRGSILLDAKADYLLYGMAEISVLELATALKYQTDPRSIRGLCYPINAAQTSQIPAGYIELPSFEKVNTDPHAFIDMFHIFYRNNDPVTARGLYQQHINRFVVQNPPARIPTQVELDAVYGLDYSRVHHPYYESQGQVKALETIQFSISTHRGCYGECNFCAIAVHEGRTVRWRSQKSILDEARTFLLHPEFKGIISDLGGPTANMYGFECAKKYKAGSCPDKRCLTPKICPALKIDHRAQIALLKQIRNIPGIKKAFVASGIRYDMVLGDSLHGRQYLQQLVSHHISGQMKIAPEHSEERVLNLMGKSDLSSLEQFTQWFDQINQAVGKEQFLTYYLIAAHPGCTYQDMRNLRRFTTSKLGTIPEQIQIFTPAPSTYSSLMYYTGLDPFTRQPIFVEKDQKRKDRQKQILGAKPPRIPATNHSPHKPGIPRSYPTRRLQPKHSGNK
jgi:uncharacterized radical SAM protein YgiQ